MKKGFTLLECLVVVLVIGICLLVAFSSLSGHLLKLKLQNAGLQVETKLRYAKESAKTRSGEVEVICRQNKYGSGNDWDELPAGISFRQEKTFRFGSTGYPVPGYAGTVILDGGPASRRVVVSSVGRVRVE